MYIIHLYISRYSLTRLNMTYVKLCILLKLMNYGLCNNLNPLMYSNRMLFSDIPSNCFDIFA